MNVQIGCEVVDDGLERRESTQNICQVADGVLSFPVILHPSSHWSLDGERFIADSNYHQSPIDYFHRAR